MLKPATLASWLKVTVLPAERAVAIFAYPVAVDVADDVDAADDVDVEIGWLIDNLEYAKDAITAIMTNATTPIMIERCPPNLGDVEDEPTGSEVTAGPDGALLLGIPCDDAF